MKGEKHSSTEGSADAGLYLRPRHSVDLTTLDLGDPRRELGFPFGAQFAPVVVHAVHECLGERSPIFGRETKRVVEQLACGLGHELDLKLNGGRKATLKTSRRCASVRPRYASTARGGKSAD